MESNKKYSDKFKTIRIKVEDYNALLNVAKKTGLKIVSLIGNAIPLLHKKYRRELNDKQL